MTKVRKTCYEDCKKSDEDIDHVSGCSKLAQEYKRWNDNLDKIVYWKLARKCNFEAGDKRYEHELIKSCGNSVLRLILLKKLGDQIWL